MSSPPDNKGYLSGLSFSPWSSRPVTPRPGQTRSTDSKGTAGSMLSQRGGDHTVSHRHRLSLRNYPKDCPPLAVQWFHAVDVPKRKPLPSGQIPVEATEAPPPKPKKYSPFSAVDSKTIETAFQRLSDEEDGSDREKLLRGFDFEDGADDMGVRSETGTKLRKSGVETSGAVKVPVNEDYLFDVDVEKRELAPTYWLGPVYDVRRGTWFFQDNVPCDENLATQLEEGYLKLKAWRLSSGPSHQRSVSQSRSRPVSVLDEAPTAMKSVAQMITPKSSSDSLKSNANTQTLEKEKESGDVAPTPPVQRTNRLFGAYMNSVVTYQDASTAWIINEDLFTRMSSGYYERFAGGAHFAGRKVVRGYADTTKKPEGKDDKDSATDATSARKSSGTEYSSSEKAEPEPDKPSPSETRRMQIERQISSLIETGSDPQKQEEELNKRDEQEIEDDYKDQDGDEQGRDIEHLILVTHGIGQRLGLRMESVNFVHDVNTLRKTMKGVYSNSADLQALNGEVENPTKNSRVQVLPICWRHLLDFPKQSLKHNRKEHDLGDTEFAEDEEYPSLDDITVEGVPAVRNLITDLALDILLYQSPAYKGHITRIVLEELNRIYKLFKVRNPNFNGKVSFVGHSLGSAIMFDILCGQEEDNQPSRSNSGRHREKHTHRNQLEFEVEDFYAIGSPIGMFQMLKGRTIAARKTPNVKPAQTPFGDPEDPFGESEHEGRKTKHTGYFEVTTSSPKCQRVFNIFHPTDPISYRLEPLISPVMANLKPQPLPYTKKGIFGVPVGEGFSGIGARVGQSVSGLWSSFSSGIASSLLNRSLGISGEDASKLGNPAPNSHNRNSLSIGAGTNISAGGVIAPSAVLAHNAEQLAQGTLTVGQGEDGEHPPTLLDTEIETLFSGFQKSRSGQESVDVDEQKREQLELEEQSRRVRREEIKLRRLNSNGRVDYSIQEGAFDISILASIASHLSYWADEDVSHFIISQLLARHRVLKGVPPIPPKD